MKTKSEEIVDEIMKKIKSYNDFIENLGQEMNIDVMNGAPYDPAYDIQSETEKEDTDYFVNENIDKLQRSSLKDSFYFFDCPFDVYLHHYPKRKAKFLESHIDVDESDFIKAELESRIDYKNERFFFMDFETVFYDKFLDYNRSLIASENKKIEFLERKLELLGWDANVIEDEDKVPFQYYFEKNENFKGGLSGNDKLKKNDFKTSKDLSDFIANKIIELNEYRNTVGEDLNFKIDQDEIDILTQIKEKDAFEKKTQELGNVITKLLNELYYKSVEDDFYFYDCSLKVYKRNLSTRYNEYIKKYIDDDFTDFLNDEISKLKNPTLYRDLHYKGNIVNYSRYINLRNDALEQSKAKKKHFIEDALRKKYDLKEILEIRKEKIESTKTNNEVERIDDKVDNQLNKEKIEKNDVNRLTANQAVILLDKIGFFTHSSIEHLSKNKQAKIISKLIGRDKKNIAVYITKLETKKPSEAYSRDISTIDNLLES